jgi:hypothetical protein
MVVQTSIHKALNIKVYCTTGAKSIFKNNFTWIMLDKFSRFIVISCKKKHVRKVRSKVCCHPKLKGRSRLSQEHCKSNTAGTLLMENNCCWQGFPKDSWVVINELEVRTCVCLCHNNSIFHEHFLWRKSAQSLMKLRRAAHGFIG